MQMLMLYLELLKKFHENLKKRFAHRCKFSTMISLNLFCFCKRYLPIWIEEWLGKIWWNIFTWKIRFLQSPKHGRYLWCRIHEGKKSKDFWNKKLRRISPFVSLEQWIIARWCIWKLSEYVPWNIWTRPCLCSYCNRNSMAGSTKMKKNKIRCSNNSDMLLIVKKVSKVKYAMLFIVMRKLLVNKQ